MLHYKYNNNYPNAALFHRKNILMGSTDLKTILACVDDRNEMITLHKYEGINWVCQTGEDGNDLTYTRICDRTIYRLAEPSPMVGEELVEFKGILQQYFDHKKSDWKMEGKELDGFKGILQKYFDPKESGWELVCREPAESEKEKTSCIVC